MWCRVPLPPTLSPSLSACLPVCVWNISIDVKLVLCLLQGAHGHLDGIGQRSPIQVAVQMYLQFLNRDGMWLTQELPCRFSTRVTSEFELSTWTDEGDFSFIFLHSWRYLRLRWTSCPFHSSAYIVGFFLVSIDYILFFKVATKEFSFHSTPNLPVRCKLKFFCTTDAFHIKIW